MAKRDDPSGVARQVAAGLLLAVCMAPWGAAVAGITGHAASGGAVTFPTSSWRAVVAAPNSQGTIGATYALNSWQGGNDFSRTYVGMPNARDSSPVDGVNRGSETLLTQDYVLTVALDGSARQISLWLCEGSNANWSKTACNTNSVHQVGDTYSEPKKTASQTSDTHVFFSGSAPAFSLGSNSSFALLVVITGAGKPAADSWHLGVQVSRTASVRAGTSVNA